MILQYNHNHDSWFNRCNGSEKTDKIYLRCKNINVKIQINIKIKIKIKMQIQIAKENSGKEKFCARMEIAFFPLAIKAIPNTRLIIYILVHFWHLSSIIVAKNMLEDDANNNVFNKNKKPLCKVNKSGLIFLFDCILYCNICLINVCCDLYVCLFFFFFCQRCN